MNVDIDLGENDFVFDIVMTHDPNKVQLIVIDMEKRHFFVITWNLSLNIQSNLY